MWDEWYNFQHPQDEESDDDSHIDHDFFSVLSKPKEDYYKILEVDYDAPEEVIHSNYISLALKWHPDKKKNEDSATSRFQEINEAYQGIATDQLVGFSEIQMNDSRTNTLLLGFAFEVNGDPSKGGLVHTISNTPSNRLTEKEVAGVVVKAAAEAAEKASSTKET